MTTNFTQQHNDDQEELHLVERVVRISRVAKVVKGGRHLSFNAVVVVGDGESRVGIGMGKADAVPDAVRKGSVKARANMVNVALSGSTIPPRNRLKVWRRACYAQTRCTRDRRNCGRICPGRL